MVFEWQKKVATEQPAHTDPRMAAITQGDETLRVAPSATQHPPMVNQSHRTPKRSQNNNKFGKKGRRAPYQSPQRVPGSGGGGHYRRSSGWNQPPPQRNYGHSSNYGPQYNSGRDHSHYMRDPNRESYHDHDPSTQYNQSPYWENRSHSVRDDDYDYDYCVDTHNCFFPLRDREGPTGYSPQGFENNRRDYDNVRSGPSQ